METLTQLHSDVSWGCITGRLSWPRHARSNLPGQVLGAGRQLKAQLGPETGVCTHGFSMWHGLCPSRAAGLQEGVSQEPAFLEAHTETSRLLRTPSEVPAALHGPSKLPRPAQMQEEQNQRSPLNGKRSKAKCDHLNPAHVV